VSEMRKSIFITGAASGVGRETALLFAGKGWFVGACDINGSALAELEREIGSDRALFFQADVADPEGFADAMARFAAATNNRLDLLFSNAGIGSGGMLDEQPWDDVVRIVNVNFLGVMISVRAAIPLLRNSPGSLCLITSSSSAIFGTAGISVYSATKHAARGLAEALSIELKRYGVRASTLLPGLVDTPLLSGPMRALAPPDGMWRLVAPRAVAETVLRAYQEDRLHWYIPEELRDFHLDVVTAPEAVREERAALLEMMARHADANR